MTDGTDVYPDRRDVLTLTDFWCNQGTDVSVDVLLPMSSSVPGCSPRDGSGDKRCLCRGSRELRFGRDFTGSRDLPANIDRETLALLPAYFRSSLGLRGSSPPTGSTEEGRRSGGRGVVEPFLDRTEFSDGGSRGGHVCGSSDLRPHNPHPTPLHFKV